MIALFWVSAIICGAICATILIRAYREWDQPPHHTLDCLDFRRRGLRDVTCNAEHGTTWFAPESENTK